MAQKEEHFEDGCEFVNKDEDYEEQFQALLWSSLDDHISRSKSQDPRGKILQRNCFPISSAVDTKMDGNVGLVKTPKDSNKQDLLDVDYFDKKMKKSPQLSEVDDEIEM